MIIRSWMFPAGSQEANVHLLACSQMREAALIDAGGFSDEIRAEVERLGLRVTQVLITHGHFDHVDALDEVVSAFGAKVLDAQTLTEGDTVRVGALTGRVLKTSGHTPDSLTFVFENCIAFTGDALFAGSVGGTSSAANQREQIDHLRAKVLILPDVCEVRPGHGPASTIGIERTANPFFND